MHKWITFLFCYFLTLPFLSLDGSQEELYHPPAFEKLYVTPTEIFSTFEGTYYLSPTGETIKVSAISRDSNGPYIILITRQCPICGKYYVNENAPEDGFCCPLWEVQPDRFFTQPNL